MSSGVLLASLGGLALVGIVLCALGVHVHRSRTSPDRVLLATTVGTLGIGALALAATGVASRETVFTVTDGDIGVGNETLGFAIVTLLSLTAILWLVFLVGATIALLRTTYRYDYLNPAVGVSLGLAVPAPFFGYTFTQQVVGPSMVVATAGEFLLAGALVAVPVYRYDALELSPAASNVGRDSMVGELSDVVVVVDGDERVVDLNPAARETLDVDGSEPLGVSLADLIGTDLATLRGSDVVDVPTTNGRRRFDAAVSELTDHSDGLAGHLVTLRDVTDRAIREQRLAVLNRILRHNLRNDMTVAHGVADIAIEDGTVPESLARDLREKAANLMAIGEKAREMERHMEGVDPHARVAVEPLVTAVVEDARERFPAARIETDLPPELTVRGDRGLLAYLLGNLVENAVEHNDADRPWVAVRATRTDAGVAVTVEDDGPGIPDHERAVIEAGDESSLEHGSGLGLWIAKWGTMRLGGDLAFPVTDEGTTVEVRLPAAEEPAG